MVCLPCRTVEWIPAPCEGPSLRLHDSIESLRCEVRFCDAARVVRSAGQRLPNRFAVPGLAHSRASSQLIQDGDPPKPQQAGHGLKFYFVTFSCAWAWQSVRSSEARRRTPAANPPPAPAPGRRTARTRQGHCSRYIVGKALPSVGHSSASRSGDIFQRCSSAVLAPP